MTRRSPKIVANFSMARGARPGSCLIAALVLGAGLAGFLSVFGGAIATILFMHVEDLVDLDADERLPRGGPGDVLSKSPPRLAEAGLAGAPLSERPYRFSAQATGKPQDGWERVYRSAMSADGTVILRLDASRELVREVVLPRPAPPVTWEALAGRRAWGPPASTTDKGDTHVSHWVFPIAGFGDVKVKVRWHGARPGVLDEIYWVRLVSSPSGDSGPRGHRGTVTCAGWVARSP